MGQFGFVHVTQGSSAEFPYVDAMTLEKLLAISYHSYVGVSGGKNVRKGRISRRHFITKPIQISEKNTCGHTLLQRAKISILTINAKSMIRNNVTSTQRAFCPALIITHLWRAWIIF